MTHRVCPWWIGYFLLSPLRRIVQNPRRILEPFVSAGMWVLEPGPGMGYFTLELARLVGTTGKVVAIDLQPKMLSVLRGRAARAGLLERMELRLSRGEELGVGDLSGRVDLVVAFAMVHEMPNAAAFFRESAGALKRGGRLLLAEPMNHLEAGAFETELAAAREAGLLLESRPSISQSLTALLIKG